MKKQTKPTRAQRQLKDTAGMTGAEMKRYILAIDGFVTPELTARYLSGSDPGSRLHAQWVRLKMRAGELPIGIVSGNQCKIIPEWLVKWKEGEFGLDHNTLTRELVSAFKELPELIDKQISLAISKCVQFGGSVNVKGTGSGVQAAAFDKGQ